MREIRLTQGKVALVDDEDFEHLSKFNWYVVNGYAGRTAYKKVNGKWVYAKTIYMHRVILNCPNGFDTDHLNGNQLDNRKLNLRVATKAQNRHNQCKNRKNKSGFKGVSWDKKKNRWVAGISVDCKHIYIGIFKNPEEAARAYDEAALKYHGEFAKTNKMISASEAKQ